MDFTIPTTPNSTHFANEEYVDLRTNGTLRVTDGESNSIMNSVFNVNRWFADEGITTQPTSGEHYIKGYGGDDLLIGATNFLTCIFGGDGNDTIYGGSVADVLSGGVGDDTIYAGAGDDYSVYGGAGNDTLYGQAGGDKIHGGDGDDILHGGADADMLYGGSGSDTASFAGGSMHAVRLTLVSVTFSGSDPDRLALQGNGSNQGDAEGDLLFSIENLIGTDYNDTLTGNDEDNIIEGGIGADTLEGGGGTDTLSYKNSAADVISGVGVVVNLSTDFSMGGDATGDTISGFENIIGSQHVDTLTGDAFDNILEGGAGGDSLVGGSGSDTASYANSNGVKVSLDTYTLFARSGDAVGDTFMSIENLLGSSNSDTLIGDASANKIEGGAGNDTIGGGEGDDTLHGGNGNDTIRGGDGADEIYGDSGGDTLRGGAGADSYYFNPGDGEDRIVDSSMGNKIYFVSDSEHVYGVYDPDMDPVIAAGDLIFTRSSADDTSGLGSDLNLQITASGDGFINHITIEDYYGATGGFTIYYDGTMVDSAIIPSE